MNWISQYFEPNFFETWRKRRAIRSYARRLPRLLAKDYGASKTYTPQQVRKTIGRSGMNTDYSCYGIAMFSGRDDFNQYHQEIGEHCSYDAMRGEIADSCFHGNADFTASDLSSFSDSGSLGGDAGGGDSGGSGDSGGGGDGGGGGGD